MLHEVQHGGAGENKMAIMKTKNFILRFTEEELQTAKEKAAQAGITTFRVDASVIES